MSEYILKLYVTGDTPRAGRAIANLRKLCEAELEDRYEIIVINVLDHPELAEEEKILATPTLVRHLPPPLRRQGPAWPRHLAVREGRRALPQPASCHPAQ